MLLFLPKIVKAKNHADIKPMMKNALLDVTQPVIVDPVVYDAVDMDRWRWCSKTSNGWQPVRNENHARALIDNIDKYWPWLMIEKETAHTRVITSIASCSYGLILDASIQTGELARVYRLGVASSRVISIREDDIPFRKVRADELLSIRETSRICIEWIKEETLDGRFGLRLQPVQF